MHALVIALAAAITENGVLGQQPFTPVWTPINQPVNQPIFNPQPAQAVPATSAGGCVDRRLDDCQVYQRTGACDGPASAAVRALCPVSCGACRGTAPTAPSRPSVPTAPSRPFVPTSPSRPSVSQNQISGRACSADWECLREQYGAHALFLHAPPHAWTGACMCAHAQAHVTHARTPRPAPHGVHGTHVRTTRDARMPAICIHTCMHMRIHARVRVWRIRARARVRTRAHTRTHSRTRTRSRTALVLALAHGTHMTVHTRTQVLLCARHSAVKVR